MQASHQVPCRLEPNEISSLDEHSGNEASDPTGTSSKIANLGVLTSSAANGTFIEVRPANSGPREHGALISLVH